MFVTSYTMALYSEDTNGWSEKFISHSFRYRTLILSANCRYMQLV